jgi:hypothetical protein
VPRLRIRGAVPPFPQYAFTFYQKRNGRDTSVAESVDLLGYPYQRIVSLFFLVLVSDSVPYRGVIRMHRTQAAAYVGNTKELLMRYPTLLGYKEGRSSQGKRFN